MLEGLDGDTDVEVELELELLEGESCCWIRARRLVVRPWKESRESMKLMERGKRRRLEGGERKISKNHQLGECRHYFYGSVPSESTDSCGGCHGGVERE